MEVTYNTSSGSYSPEDFARMKAGRLLLNDPPPISDRPVTTTQGGIDAAMIESNISGSGVKIDHCVVQHICEQFGSEGHCLELARLTAVFYLRCGGVAEEILELELGPIGDEGVPVTFRGRRKRKAINVDPADVEVKGVCPLA